MKKKSFLLGKVKVFLLIVALSIVLPHYVQAQTMVGVSGGSGGGYSNPGSYMTVDDISGAVTILGTPYGGVGLPGVATSSSGRVYAVTSVNNPDDTSHLIEIDPSTGALLSDIGSILDASGNGCGIGDLSFQPGTNVLFGLTGNQSKVGTTRCGVGSGSGGYLLTINTTTAQYTIIGRDQTFGNDNGGIAFAPDGTLYFTPDWKSNDGFIYTLDPATANVLTSQALASGFGYMGLAVRPSDGTIFASYRASEDTTGIYTIDPVTGIETLVGDPITINILDLTFLGAATPIPDIKANGSDDPVTISQSDILSVTVQINAGSMIELDADWWVVAHTPFSPPNDWYYFNLDSGWMPGRSVTYQGPLFNLSPYEVSNISGLPLGTYRLYFGVDMDMNGSLDLDQAFYDSVKVNITP